MLMFTVPAGFKVGDVATVKINGDDTRVPMQVKAPKPVEVAA
jgi:hypothetical protein